jgi:hypothetical protein
MTKILTHDRVADVGERGRRSWKGGSASTSYADGGCRECRYELSDVC